MNDQNRQVAIKFVEAMGANDAEGVRECFAPDGVTVAMGTTRFSGVRTLDQVVAGVEAFKQMMPEGLKFTILSVSGDADRVIVEAEGNAVTCDGQPYRNNYCMVLTMENGKIKLANEYFCTKLADEVLWPLAERMHALGETQ